MTAETSSASSAPAACPHAAAAPALRPAAEIPGPDPWPVVGWRGRVARFFRNPIAVMSELRRRHGDVACLVRGGNDSLVLKPPPRRTLTVFGFGPERNREILGQPDVFESAPVRAPEECPWLSDNLVAVNRRERACQRKTILPALAAGHLKAYYPDVVALTGEMLDRWQAGETVELTEELEDLTAAVASKTFYGQDARDEPEALAAIAREVAQKVFSPLANVPIDLPGTPYRRLLGLTRKAEAAIAREIDRRRTDGLEGDDVLSMMLREIDAGGVAMSQRHLVGNAFTLFLAGHDVPANALGMTLYLLAQHPRVAADLHAELDAALGGAAPAYEEVWKLPLLDRVVKESMRVLSPAIFVWRRLTEATALGGYEVPAGSEVLASPYMTHVDPEVYPRPLRFEPERWEARKPGPFEYLPFSYGARKCLGAAFAEMLLRVAVAMIVQRYRLELVAGSKIDLKITFTMKPSPGLPVVVRPQDREFDRSRAPVRGQIRDLVDLDDL